MILVERLLHYHQRSHPAGSIGTVMMRIICPPDLRPKCPIPQLFRWPGSVWPFLLNARQSLAIREANEQQEQNNIGNCASGERADVRIHTALMAVIVQQCCTQKCQRGE